MDIAQINDIFLPLELELLIFGYPTKPQDYLGPWFLYQAVSSIESTFLKLNLDPN